MSAPAGCARSATYISAQPLRVLRSLLSGNRFSSVVQLRNPEVTRFMSRAQADYVEGEILQTKNLFEVVSLDGTKRPEKQWIWRRDNR